MAKIKSFFHFLYKQNLTKQDFSKLIQKCTIPQPHPTTYSIEEIRRLESSFDLSAKNDIRNYAITLIRYYQYMSFDKRIKKQLK